MNCIILVAIPLLPLLFPDYHMVNQHIVMSADETVQFFITYEVLSWIFSPLMLIKAWQNRYNKYYYYCCLYSNSIDEERDPGRD